MIGVFDSGVGGLTVLKELVKLMPQYSYTYLGDTARAPYGNKSEETIKRYALQNSSFLIERGARVIVVACNTASALAASYLKTQVSAPVFEVITSAVTRVLEATKNNRVAILGTRATIESGVYRRALLERNKNLEIFEAPCPLIAPLIEEGWGKRPETRRILRYYLRTVKMKQADTVILGCTHYPIISEEFTRILGKRAALVDGAAPTALSLKHFLERFPEVERTIKRGEQPRYFLSDITPHFTAIAKQWMGADVKIEKLN